MKKIVNQRSDSFVYLVVFAIYSTILFIFEFFTPSSLSEQKIWHFSSEKLILVISIFIILFLAFILLLFIKTKLVSSFFDWYLSSRLVHIFSTILLIISIICLTASFAGRLGRYTQISWHLFSLMIIMVCFLFETILFQLIHTKGKIGGKVWSAISSNNINKENKLIILATFMVIGFIVVVMINYYRGSYEGKSYPYDTFLFDPAYHFGDFFTVVNETDGMNPYGEFLSGQYPFLLIIGSLFSLLKPGVSVFLYFLSFIIFYYLISYYFLRIENKPLSILLAFVITTFSYPLFISLDRGNFEITVFIFLLIFIFLYHKQKFIAAAIILGMAAALKIYPAIFILLFLKDKKYKEIIVSLGTMVGLTAFSLAIFEGGLLTNLKYLLNFSNINNNGMFLSFTSLAEGTLLQRGVTLLTLIKIIVHQLSIPVSDFLVQRFNTLYFLLVFIIFLPIVYYVLFIEKVLWRNVALLSICMLILPTLSADYKLMHMYIPLFLFLITKEQTRLDLLYLVLFASLLIPKNYFFLQNVFSDADIRHDISLAVPINILILVLMLVSIVLSGLIANRQQKAKDSQLRALLS